MKQVVTIAGRELRVYFDSLMAYIMLAAFLGFSGLFTWLYGADVFLVGQASLQTFFGIAFWTLFFFVPALTMRMFAEEKRNGTLETLLTLPVTAWDVILGKFTACLGMVAFALALTLPYYIVITTLGHADHGAILCGYLALLFLSAFYIAIGLFASSISSNQVAGFLLSLLIGILFHFVFEMLAGNLTGMAGEILSYLSVGSHFQSMARGVVDSKDVIYFVSVIYLALLLTRRQLDKIR